jgi:hypothetical protein
VKQLLIAILITLAACDECEPLETDCNGDTVEICGGSGRWEPVVDCRDYDAKCVVDNGGEAKCE